MARWIHEGLIKDADALLREPIQRLFVPLLVAPFKIPPQLANDDGRPETALTIACIHEVLSPGARPVRGSVGVASLCCVYDYVACAVWLPESLHERGSRATVH